MRADSVADRYARDTDRTLPTAAGRPTPPIRVGFVVHAMHVAGAEMLVAETIRRLRGRLEATVFTLDAVGKLGEALGAEGIPVVCFGRRKGRDLRVGWAMAAEVRRRGIEVLHAHQYTPFFYAALAKTLSGGRPRLILTEHGRHYPDTVSWRRRLANRLVLDRLADAVNGVSAFSVASLARSDGFSPGRMEIIENGVDVARYGQAMNRARARTRLGLDPFRRFIVHIARLHPVKDQSTLLKAFAQVAAARDDVDLLLVGEGALRLELEALARTLGVERRVRFLGVRSDVPEILAAADVFVLTSSCEAASLTLLEAMASELPVVVTDVGGNPEIVRNGVDGLLAPRGDVEAIAAAILRLLDHPQLAAAMGRAGAERVRTRYRLERTIDRYDELYRSLAGRREPLRLNLGCGRVQAPRWINVDNSHRAWLAVHLGWIDRLLVSVKLLAPTEFSRKTTRHCNLLKRLPWADGAVDAIYAGELLEHFTREQGERFLAECRRVLRSGGVLRIRVPDNARFWGNYVQQYAAMRARPRSEWTLDHTRWMEMFFREICVEPRRLRSAGHYHKWAYDEISLIKTLERLGFEDVQRRAFLESRIEEVSAVEARDDLIVEATKPEVE